MWLLEENRNKSEYGAPGLGKFVIVSFVYTCLMSDSYIS